MRSGHKPQESRSQNWKIISTVSSLYTYTCLSILTQLKSSATSGDQREDGITFQKSTNRAGIDSTKSPFSADQQCHQPWPFAFQFLAWSSPNSLHTVHILCILPQLPPCRVCDVRDPLHYVHAESPGAKESGGLLFLQSLVNRLKNNKGTQYRISSGNWPEPAISAVVDDDGLGCWGMTLSPELSRLFPWMGMTSLDHFSAVLQTGHGLNTFCSHWCRQGQQNKWPHDVATGFVGTAKQMWHSNEFDCSSEPVEQLLSIVVNLCGLHRQVS